MLTGLIYNKVVKKSVSERKINFIIILLAVIVAGLLWFFVFSKIIPMAPKQYANPAQLGSIPSVFKGWPIEKENLLSNFYVYLPSPVDKQYAVVYQTTKSSEEILNVYRDFLKGMDVNFTEEESYSENTKMTSKILRPDLLPNKNDQAMIIIQKGGQVNQVLVNLIYTTYEKGFKKQ